MTDSITLPEDWTAIKGFSGHWNSDVYEVKLNSKGTPLLANDKAEGTSGWNLGTNSSKGTQNVFNNSKDMIRTTGVARVPVSYTHLDVYKRQCVGCNDAVFGSTEIFAATYYPGIAMYNDFLYKILSYRDTKFKRVAVMN